MKSFKIDPHLRTVTEIELPYEKTDHSRAFLNACYKEISNDHVKCDLIEFVSCGKPTLEVDVDLVIDEEGLLKPNAFFAFKGYPHRQPYSYGLAGTALVVGPSDGAGDVTETRATLDQVKSWVRWIDHPLQAQGDD